MTNALEYKGYSARVEFEAEDELFVGRLAGITDIISFHGSTVDELKTAFHESVDDYLVACAEIGKPPERPYSGNVMFRIDPAIHAKAALAAQLSGKSLNQWAEDVLARASERA